MANKSKKKKKVSLIVGGIILASVLVFILVIVIINLSMGSYFVPNMVLKSDGTYAGAGIDHRFGSKTDVLEYPAEYEGKPVTEIYGWSKSRSDFFREVKTVIVPEGVTKIGDYAFGGYENLERLVLPSTLREMGAKIVESNVTLEFAGNEYFSFKNGCVIETAKKALVLAFNNCTIPNDVEIIRESACSGTRLGVVSLPSVKTIEATAFAESTVTSVSLPAVEIIGEAAFIRCESLKTVTITTALHTIEGNAFYDCPIQDLYYNGTKEGFEAIGSRMDAAAFSQVGEYHHMMLHLADGDVLWF